VGVDPDIVVELSEEEQARLFRTRLGLGASSEDRNPQSAATDDAQLARAVEVLKGIQLLGHRMTPGRRMAALPDTGTTETP
jgi:hypothetical protein